MPAAKKNSTPKLRPDFSLESTSDIVCGMDEAGRGPLAGPVFAACVYIPAEKRNHPVWRDVNDSKKLSHDKREILFEIIQQQSCFGIYSCSTEDIEKLNILHASLMAMKNAYETMCATFNITPTLALIDGNKTPLLNIKAQAVVKGDSKSISIAAASILAKVARDRAMQCLHESFPMYSWHKNAGYGTAEHMAAIAQHGITIHHRRGFAPIADMIRSDFKKA